MRMPRRDRFLFNDYPLLPSTRHALSTDLVIRDAGKEVLVAAEFKYEPSHRRAEFFALPGKLAVVFWGRRASRRMSFESASSSSVAVRSLPLRC
jgi:hypothetical protein